MRIDQLSDETLRESILWTKRVLSDDPLSDEERESWKEHLLALQVEAESRT